MFRESHKNLPYYDILLLLENYALLLHRNVFKTFYEAWQDIVYIQLPPGIKFVISLKRSEITQMGVFLVFP